MKSVACLYIYIYITQLLQESESIIYGYKGGKGNGGLRSQLVAGWDKGVWFFLSNTNYNKKFVDNRKGD